MVYDAGKCQDSTQCTLYGMGEITMVLLDEEEGCNQFQDQIEDAEE